MLQLAETKQTTENKNKLSQKIYYKNRFTLISNKNTFAVVPEQKTASLKTLDAVV